MPRTKKTATIIDAKPQVVKQDAIADAEIITENKNYAKPKRSKKTIGVISDRDLVLKRELAKADFDYSFELLKTASYTNVLVLANCDTFKTAITRVFERLHNQRAAARQKHNARLKRHAFDFFEENDLTTGAEVMPHVIQLYAKQSALSAANRDFLGAVTQEAINKSFEAFDKACKTIIDSSEVGVVLTAEQCKQIQPDVIAKMLELNKNLQLDEIGENQIQLLLNKSV